MRFSKTGNPGLDRPDEPLRVSRVAFLHLREDWSSFPVLIPTNHVLVIFGQDSDVVCTFFEQKGFLGTVDFRILGAGLDSVTYSVHSAPFPDFAASFLPATTP